METGHCVSRSPITASIKKFTVDPGNSRKNPEGDGAYADSDNGQDLTSVVSVNILNLSNKPTADRGSLQAPPRAHIKGHVLPLG